MWVLGFLGQLGKNVIVHQKEMGDGGGMGLWLVKVVPNCHNEINASMLIRQYICWGRIRSLKRGG